MFRFILIALVALPGLFTPQVAMSQGTCTAVASYFTELDSRMAREIEPLLRDARWIADFEQAVHKAESSPVGIEALTEQELELVLDFFDIPGNVLLDLPHIMVPTEFESLHKNATEYWLTLPGLFQLIHSDGPLDAEAYSIMERLEDEIRQDLEALAESCPELVDDLQRQSAQLGEPPFSLLVVAEKGSFSGFAFSLISMAQQVEVHIPESTSGTIPLDYMGIQVEQSDVVNAAGNLPGELDFATLEFHTGAIVGDPNAPVTMHIFSDFQCNFCKSFHDESLPWIIEDFVRNGQVKLVFHDFPRLGTDQSITDPEDLSVEINDSKNESAQAAHAAMCAGEQGKYLEYSDRLFGNFGGVQQGAYSRANLDRFAEDQALNMDSFNICMESGRYLPAIAISVEQGQNNGIAATPMFILDNGSGDLNVIQQTAEGYSLIKRQIEASIQTAP